MVTLEQAEKAVQTILKISHIYPWVQAVGVTKIDDDYAVSVTIGEGKPETSLPESISGVKIVYRYNRGEIVPL